MNVFTVAFFGHRHIGSDSIHIEKRLEEEIRCLLRDKEYVEFLVGRNGDYDLLVSSVINRCKKEYRSDNSSHNWVLPYVTAEYRDNEEDYRAYYDEIEVFEAGAHFKSAFQARNQSMIDRADLVIFYVDEQKARENESAPKMMKRVSGAYEALKYSEAQGVSYINLHEKTKGEKK